MINWASLKILLLINIFLSAIISKEDFLISSLASNRSFKAPCNLDLISLSFRFLTLVMKLNCFLFGLNLKRSSSRCEGDFSLLNSVCWYLVSLYYFLRSSKVRFTGESISLKYLYVNLGMQFSIINLNALSIVSPWDLMISAELFLKEFFNINHFRLNNLCIIFHKCLINYVLKVFNSFWCFKFII